MKKLNIGPGPDWQKDGWATLDFYNVEADILCDLRTQPRLPLPTSSLRKVFCSHVIEHLADAAVLNLFQEVHRILEFGGIARFSCPDLEKALAQYRGGQCDPAEEVITRTMREQPPHIRLLNIVASFRAPSYQGIVNTARGDYSGAPIVESRKVNRKLRQTSLKRFAKWVHSLIPDDATYRAHINAFWADRVSRMLRAAGFEDVRISSYQASSDRELRGVEFDNRPEISLFVEVRATGTHKKLSTMAFQARRKLKKASLRALARCH